MDQKKKIAFIGPYNSNCGIATYNSELLKELGKYVDFKIFADGEAQEDDPDYVVRCWERSEYPKLLLMKEVLEYNPDLIHFMHEYGFWANAFYFTSIVSFFKTKGFKVITTLHSIYEHLDKVVSENASEHLIVHTDQAKNCLIEKGIDEHKIFVIPHGAEAGVELLPNLWDTWNNKHTIFQPGFLFYYKGHLTTIEAVRILKEKYPDVHYIIQGSENKQTQSEHDKLYKEICTKISEYGLEHNVTINRGFVDKKIIMSHIRTVRVCVLPYVSHPEHDVYATSGIARMVLTTTTPLVVSKVHLFDDVKELVPSISTAEELAECIDRVFENDDEKNRQISLREAFLSRITWAEIAKQTNDVYAIVLKGKSP